MLGCLVALLECVSPGGFFECSDVPAPPPPPPSGPEAYITLYSKPQSTDIVTSSSGAYRLLASTSLAAVSRLLVQWNRTWDLVGANRTFFIFF